MNVRDTYRSLNPDVDEHLWVIVTPPDATGLVAVANFTTLKVFSDTCCVIQPGEHPFVRHETVVYYPGAEMRSLSAIELGLEKHLVRQLPPVSSALLDRIQTGALRCEHTAPAVIAAVQAARGL